MSSSSQLMTADELLAMPDDGFRYELVNGELKKMAPAGHEHGHVTFEFSLHLGQHVKANGLGRVYAAETGFLLTTDPDTVRAPDVAFVRSDRLAQAKQTKVTGLARLTLPSRSFHQATRIPRSRKKRSPGSRRAHRWCLQSILANAR